MTIALTGSASMLKISRLETAGPFSVLLKVEGQIRGDWVDALRRACEDALQGNGHRPQSLALDLSDVSFIDAEGLSLLRALAARRVHLRNRSLFAAEQLKGVADADQ